MNRPAARGKSKAYVRPMRGWWRRNPFFVQYMVREATALAVAVYALVLTVGVVRLSQGEAAWNGWLASLRTPASLLLHLVLLVSMVIHAKSWFEIMPKTMPPILVGGRRLTASVITRLGWAAVIVASCVMSAIVMRWRQ